MNSTGGGLSILHFRVKIAGGAGSVGALYNNGHHQCHVVIEVVKGIKNRQGAWRAIELTEEERESVTVTALSNNPDAELPEGWSCDRQRNAFDLGLWTRTEKTEEAERYEEVFMFDCRVEQISRYICAELSAPLKSVGLMAKMTLGGEVYTTGLSEDGLGFESSVIIESVRPYILSVADLTEYRDDPALLEGGVHGICYYWTPPAGLTFTYSSGLSRPVKFSDEGVFFQTAYVHNFNESIGYKGGVVVGKDVIGLQLRLNDVHHGYHYPHNDPTFKFNEKPTIMRAIILRDRMPALREDSGSVWRLWDNRGNQHSFKLVADGEYRLRLMDVIEPPYNVNVKEFKIYLRGEQVESNELYANGRHQCKVSVEVLKEIENSDGGWESVALTEDERESLTVTLFSANDQAQLPRGWSCDKEKNMFDAGLWRQGAEEQVLDDDVHSIVSDSRGEWIDRYMRLDSGVPIESHKFMARIIIGGKIYTTHSRSGNTFVTITPVRPYVLRDL